MAEGVLVFIIGPTNNLVLPNVPNNWKRTPQEYQLHDGIIQRYKIGENVQVASSKNNGIEFLSLQRNTGARFDSVDLEEQDEDAGQVGHVAC